APSQGVAGVATITYLSGLLAPAVTGWVAHLTSLPVTFAVLSVIVLTTVATAGALRPRTPLGTPAEEGA
ncbi:hypothetical protein ACFQ08_12190, partial [Streptosporangium algeriense]